MRVPVDGRGADQRRLGMNQDTKMATYWTAGSVAVLVVLVLIAWLAGVFEAVPK